MTPGIGSGQFHSPAGAEKTRMSKEKLILYAADVRLLFTRH